MKTPRLPIMVRSQATAKRRSGSPSRTRNWPALTALQSSAETASSKAPGRSSRRLSRSAGASRPNGPANSARAAAASAGAGASHCSDSARRRRLRETTATSSAAGAIRVAASSHGPRVSAAIMARSPRRRPAGRCRGHRRTTAARNRARRATSASASATASRLRRGGFARTIGASESAGARMR